MVLCKFMQSWWKCTDLLASYVHKIEKSNVPINLCLISKTESHFGKMICTQALALLSLFVYNVFGAGEPFRPRPRSYECRTIFDCSFWRGEWCQDGICVDPLIWYQKRAKPVTDQPWTTPSWAKPIPLPTPKPKCKTCKSRFNCKWWRLQKCVDGCCRSRKS